MKNTKTIFLSALILCAALALAACGAEKEVSGDSGDALFGKFTAMDIDGATRDESIFADHDVTMVNIWGTFCAPCIKEMPDLAALNTEYSDQKFQVVGIVADVIGRNGEQPQAEYDAALSIIEQTGADYLHLLPSEDLMNLKLKDVTGVPETVFVDSTGAVIGESYVGARSKKAWAKIIDEILEQVK